MCTPPTTGSAPGRADRRRGAWVGEGAVGFPGVPGIFGERQVEGWRRVTGLVHALGGRIVLQLWHAGAHSHPDHRGGARPTGLRRSILARCRGRRRAPRRRSRRWR
ncbi:hypothetical protein ACFQY7_11650 [Actinomadura luteofluorescens]|uniref:oxidoreductase n=1 Tax=Actinomadura luteofluorescens TaxID=46163 RepID=UPI0036446F7C